MRVRSVEVVDQLDRDDRRLVLLEDHAVLLVGLAPAILDLTREWCSLDRLAEELESRFGTPSGVSAVEAIRRAVADLADQGIVRIDDAEEA